MEVRRMYRCERCGNTTRFVVDFMDRRFGTVEAEWLEDEDDWPRRPPAK